jgi:hypothetical protein
MTPMQNWEFQGFLGPKKINIAWGKSNFIEAFGELILKP